MEIGRKRWRKIDRGREGQCEREGAMERWRKRWREKNTGYPNEPHSA